ncbi:hypothetical protein FOL47_001233, partial [Perkinsus chesapeaki]
GSYYMRSSCNSSRTSMIKARYYSRDMSDKQVVARIEVKLHMLSLGNHLVQTSKEVFELKTISYHDLPDDMSGSSAATMDAKLIVRLLHCKAPEKAVRFNKFGGAQGTNPNKKVMVEQCYHRWVLCYDILTGEPVVVITHSAKESHQLLTFVGDLYPGATAALVEPETVGVLDNGLKLLSSPDRLVPIKAEEVTTEIPSGIEHFTQYRVYNFHLESLELLGFTTPSLNNPITIVSHRVTALFVDEKASVGICRWSARQLRPTIKQILSYICNHGGFVVTAWVKPGRQAAVGDEVGAITESKLHVCSLRPSNPEVINVTKDMRMKLVVQDPNNLNIQPAQIQGPQRQGAQPVNVPPLPPQQQQPVPPPQQPVLPQQQPQPVGKQQEIQDPQQKQQQQHRQNVNRQGGDQGGFVGSIFRNQEPPAVRERRLAAEAAAARAAAADSGPANENADPAAAAEVEHESDD